MSLSSPPTSASPPQKLSWSAISRLVRFQNQTGTLLLMLPTLWALVLAARGIPPLHLLAIFMTGSFVMRSAGVVLNDLADRSFDRQVTRTKTRPLASGELSVNHARAVAIFLVTIAAVLMLFLNPLSRFLSPIALVLAALYPFAKRFMHVPQAILGIAFGWGTIMAWAASRGTIEPPAWVLFGATVSWAIGYDTIYALQDQEDDRLIGVKSSALFFGSSVWLAVGASLTAMVTLVGIAGWLVGIGWLFYGIIAAVSPLCVKQTLELKKSVSRSQAFHLFQHHVWLGTAILIGMIAGFVL